MIKKKKRCLNDGVYGDIWWHSPDCKLNYTQIGVTTDPVLHCTLSFTAITEYIFKKAMQRLYLIKKLDFKHFRN